MKYELLILLGIALFLIFRLRSVLGTRDGFEKPPAPAPISRQSPDFEVIEGGPDSDIVDHVDADSDMVETLTSIKRVDPEFRLTEFLNGARAAYEMILMGFERGEINDIRAFLSEDVAQTFDDVVQQRRDQGIKIDAEFSGIREMKLQAVTFDSSNSTAELTVMFIGELMSVAKNENGDVIEGDAKKVKRQKDIWTFSKDMGLRDPNWRLVATDE